MSFIAHSRTKLLAAFLASIVPSLHANAQGGSSSTAYSIGANAGLAIPVSDLSNFTSSGYTVGITLGMHQALAPLSFRLEGNFTLGRFHALSAEQLEFLETFIRARGSFKDVERELGISYPTVRSRLDAVIRALGFPSQVETDRETERRKEILRELAEGKIAPDDAATLLEAE